MRSRLGSVVDLVAGFAAPLLEAGGLASTDRDPVGGLCRRVDKLASLRLAGGHKTLMRTPYTQPVLH